MTTIEATDPAPDQSSNHLVVLADVLRGALNPKAVEGGFQETLIRELMARPAEVAAMIHAEAREDRIGFEALWQLAMCHQRNGSHAEAGTLLQGLVARAAALGRASTVTEWVHCVSASPSAFPEVMGSDDLGMIRDVPDALLAKALAAHLTMRRAEAGHAPVNLPESVRSLQLELRRRLLAALAVLEPEPGQAAPADELDRTTFRRCLLQVLNAKSIALVANGPKLRGRKLGPAIDSHEVVIRFNFPRLADRTDDVGQRTDIMLFRNTLIKSARGMNSLLRPMQAMPEATFIASWPFSAEYRAVLGEKVARVCGLPSSLLALSRTIGYPHMTTGMLGVAFFAGVLGLPCRCYGYDLYDGADFSRIYDAGLVPPFKHNLDFERWFVRGFMPKFDPIFEPRAEGWV
jgi:hypothetical protein